MVEIIISMVQSTVYKFLYLMKKQNNPPGTQSTVLWPLWGKRAFHSFVSQNRANNYCLDYISLLPEISGFLEAFFLFQKLSTWPFAISSKDFWCSCFHIYICGVTGLLQQVKLKQKVGAQGKIERTARSTCLFNALLLATQIRFATAALFMPKVAEGLFPLWSSQFSLAQRQLFQARILLSSTKLPFS